MKNFYTLLITVSLMVWGFQSSAQKRYVDEVFSDADIETSADNTYATNIDFLTSKFTDQAKVVADLTAIKTALFLGQPIPPSHFNPLDTTTKVKVTNLKMDMYYPKSSADTATARPVIVYLHTGNFLPPGINGSPLGSRKDSLAIVLCQQWAKRGYVAISADYRLGWNPLATTVQERRGQLLNAVYRALHDVQRAVISLKVEAAGSNMYAIDPSKIVLFGEGTGAYLANAYTTLDKYTEIELPKFLNPLNSKSYIDTTTVGRLDGSGGLLNLYPPSATSSSVVATVAAGGALADTSWLEAGDAPMISLHAIRDPFAPFDEGTVVVPTTNEDVVDVQGGNVYIMKANALGNNDAFAGMPNDDMLTSIARSKYGKTYDYIYPAPRNTMTVNTMVEGLYPVDIKAGASLLENTAQPWQWWDPNSAAAKQVVAAPNITAHQASLRSNPNMSPAVGRAWTDTINGYMIPRIAIVLGYCTTGDFVGVDRIPQINASIYPNPSNGTFTISYEGQGVIQSMVVRDIQGRVVSEASLNTRNTVVNLSDLSNGTYILQLSTDEGSAVHKIQLAN